VCVNIYTGALHSNKEIDCLTVEVFRSHTIRHIHTHTVGFLTKSDQLVAEADAYTQQTQEMDIFPLAGFEPAIPAVEQLQIYALAAR
jgi:hypothetical protein